MKYVASITITEQVTEDRWIRKQYLKNIDGSTTLNGMIDWVYTVVPKHESQEQGFKLPHITIIPVEP